MTRMAIQLHGAIGTTNEYDIGLYFKRAMALASRWGNAAAHRQALLAAGLQQTRAPEQRVAARRVRRASRPTLDWDAMPEAEFRQMVRALFAKHYPKSGASCRTARPGPSRRTGT